MLEVKEVDSLAGLLNAWLRTGRKVAEALSQILSKSTLPESEPRLRGVNTCELLADKAEWLPVRFGDVVENLNDMERNPTEAGLERFIGLEHLEHGSLHVSTWGNVADGTTFTTALPSWAGPLR